MGGESGAKTEAAVDASSSPLAATRPSASPQGYRLPGSTRPQSRNEPPSSSTSVRTSYTPSSPHSATERTGSTSPLTPFLSTPNEPLHSLMGIFPVTAQSADAGRQGPTALAGRSLSVLLYSRSESVESWLESDLRSGDKKEPLRVVLSTNATDGRSLSLAGIVRHSLMVDTGGSSPGVSLLAEEEPSTTSPSRGMSLTSQTEPSSTIAPHSASPESGTVEPTSGTCGPRPATCFARYAPDSPSSRTSPDSYPHQTGLDAAYAAGLIDGEGCIGIRTKRDTYFMVTVEITMAKKGLPVLRHIQSIFGGRLKLTVHATAKTAAAWKWHMSGVSAASFLPMVIPFLRLKREQALLALELTRMTAEASRHKNGDAIWTEEMRGAARLMKERMHVLNRLGPDPEDTNWFAHLAAGEWATPQITLMGTSEKFSDPWPNSGWMRSGRCSELTTLGLRTAASGSGSSPIYPTPSATPYGSSQNGINGVNGVNRRPSAGTPSLETMARHGNWPTPTSAPEAKNLGSNRTAGPNSLEECARNGSPRWPTPRAEDSESTGAHGGRIDTLTAALRTWPTPTVGDANSSGSRNVHGSLAHAGVSLTDAVRGDGGRGRWPTPSSRDHKDGDSQSCANVPINALLGRAVDHGAPVGLKLNPAWVCWLMGWPRGWDALEPMEKEAFDEWLGRTEASAAALRRGSVLDLREYATGAAPPQGPQPGEQRARKHRDSVPALPQGRAREGGGLGGWAGEASSVPDLWHLVSGGEDEAREGVLARVSEGDGAASGSEAVGRSSNGSPVHPVRGGVSEPNEIRDVQPFVREPSRLGAAPGWWAIDPGDTGEVPRTTLGVPDRRARLRAIGNGQVPACVVAAFLALARRVEPEATGG